MSVSKRKTDGASAAWDSGISTAKTSHATIVNRRRAKARSARPAVIRRDGLLIGNGPWIGVFGILSARGKAVKNGDRHLANRETRPVLAEPARNSSHFVTASEPKSHFSAVPLQRKMIAVRLVYDVLQESATRGSRITAKGGIARSHSLSCIT
jgi:hypothetical protein